MPVVSGRKPPCTGCTLTATAPRSSWRSASAAGRSCTAGFTLATRRNRPGLYVMTGSRSSTGWMPVVPGLYSANSSAVSTPSASSRASSRAGTGSPSGPNTPRHPESRPKSAAHCIQAGVTVLSLGTCMWASTTTMPSIMEPLPVQAPQPGPVGAGGFDVGLHGALDPVRGHPGLLDLRGHAGHQGARWHLEALGHQARGGYDCAGPHRDPVQGDRARADQAPVPHDAALQ